MPRLTPLLWPLLLLAAPVAAQPRPDEARPRHARADMAAMADERVRMLSHELDLKPEQRKKVEAVVKASMEDEAALLKKLRDHNRKVHESIRALLDDDQKERFDAMRIQGGMPGGPGGPGGPDQPQRHPALTPMPGHQPGGPDMAAPEMGGAPNAPKPSHRRMAAPDDAPAPKPEER